MVKYIADRNACWMDGYTSHEFNVEVNPITFNKLADIVDGMSYMDNGTTRKYNEYISRMTCIQSYQVIFVYNPDKIKLD